MTGTYQTILLRKDGSYCIAQNGYPYHVPNEGEFAAQWEDVRAFALANPDKVTAEPEPEPVTLDAALSMAFEAIKAARDARMTEGGLVWNGWLVSIDKEATDRMTSKAVEFMAGVITETRWKMSDGEYAVLDRGAFFAMSAAVGSTIQACYGIEERKRREVEALPDAEAVLAWLAGPVNLLTGWPGDGS